MSQDFNTPKPENPNNLPEAEDIRPAGKSVMSSVLGDNVNAALPAPEFGNNDETRPHIIDGLGSTATKTAGIAYDTFLMAGESYGQYVKGLEVVSTQIERAGKYVVRGIGSAAIKASGLAVKGVKGTGNGIWQAAKVSGRGLEAGGKLAERVGKNTFEASSVMLTGLKKVVKLVRVRLAGGNEAETTGDAMFYRDAAGFSLNKLKPVKPYYPIKNFEKQNMLTDFTRKYPTPAEAPPSMSTGARTRHQELVAIRQNLRVDAINRRALRQLKFNSLYGGDIDLTDKGAMKRSLEAGRYTRGQKNAIRSAGRHVRSAKRSTSRIQGRLDRVSEGRDVAARVIRHRARLGGVNINANVAAIYKSREEAAEVAAATPHEPIVEQPAPIVINNPERPTSPSPEPHPRVVQPPKKTSPRVQPTKKAESHIQPSKKTGPDLKTADATTTVTKPELSPQDYERAAISYIAGQYRKNEPGIPFPRMSVERLTDMFEVRFKMSKDQAGQIAAKLYLDLQKDGIISAQYIPDRGFVVDPAKALKKFQEISEKTD